MYLQESSGNSRQNQGQLHKSLTASKALGSQLFAPIRKDEADWFNGNGECEDEPLEESETEDSDDFAASLIDQAKSFDEGLVKSLKRHGFDTSLLENSEAKKCLAKALLSGGRIVSDRTNKLSVDKEVPDVPPAYVPPGKLSVGDTVQLLNWKPLGVRGAKVDLYPKGKVTKMYCQKCLVTEKCIDKIRMPGSDDGIQTEDRIQALVLDKRGPFSEKEEDNPYPYIVKDDTVIIRFPMGGEPSGRTEQHSMSFM